MFELVLYWRAQALVQYPDPQSASNAKTALEGHAIYDGGYNRVLPRTLPKAYLHHKSRPQAAWPEYRHFRAWTHCTHHCMDTSLTAWIMQTVGKSMRDE